jgi:hypothetical protein
MFDPCWRFQTLLMSAEISHGPRIYGPNPARLIGKSGGGGKRAGIEAQKASCHFKRRFCAPIHLKVLSNFAIISENKKIL